jgi:hypothetical protein
MRKYSLKLFRIRGHFRGKETDMETLGNLLKVISLVSGGAGYRLNVLDSYTDP